MSRRESFNLLGVLALVMTLLFAAACGDDDAGDVATDQEETTEQTGNAGPEPTGPAALLEPRIVSADELAEVAEELGHPLYWLGEREDTIIELTETPAQGTFVRYLPEGSEAGDPDPSHESVGTYSYPDAIETLDRLVEEMRHEREVAEDGTVVVFERPRATRAQGVQPDEPDIQIEVFHPEPGRAVELLLSDEVVPVE